MLIVLELWMLTMKTKIVAMVLIAVLSLVGAVIAAWIVQPTEQTLELSPNVSVEELEELDQTVPSIASREQSIGEYAEVLVSQIGRVEVADFQAAGYANAEIRRFMLDNPRLFSRNRY